MKKSTTKKEAFVAQFFTQSEAENIERGLAALYNRTLTNQKTSNEEKLVHYIACMQRFAD
jgi:hypothetical protein